MKRDRKLKSGFSTGACAAAAAKAATEILLAGGRNVGEVEIPMPEGFRQKFLVHSCCWQDGQATASVIKDAGDDPDVTNGAEIIAIVDRLESEENEEHIVLAGGPGVGQVTKPGLPVKVGRPAINPVPERMIKEAVVEALVAGDQAEQYLRVTICVTDGDKLARKTLNGRLGIIGGLSILGTTGIVKPVSVKAWTDTIDTSMNVAKAAGLSEVIVSTGRTSEAAVEALLGLPEEALVMMGDYLAYALGSARSHGMSKVHLAGMWAKILKCGLRIPQTHVRHGALEPEQAASLLADLGLEEELVAKMSKANSAREIYEHLKVGRRDDIIEAVCRKAKEYAEEVAGIEVVVYLVTADKEVVLHV